MPRIQNTPEVLRPYIFHGVDLAWREGNKEALGTCPWCNREEKFSIDMRTSLWRCFVCGEGNKRGGGNTTIFLKKLFEESDKATTGYRELADDRQLEPDTLMHWQVCRSTLTNDWMVPGFSVDGNLKQLYCYRMGKKGKRLLFATPTIGHQLHGLNLFGRKKPEVMICEGPWDAMTLWETLRQVKITDGTFAATSNSKRSLLAEVNVVATPGCNVFFEGWCPLFAGKVVNVLFDNDYPRDNQSPVGYAGMERVACLLGEAKEPPTEINYLKWGAKGYTKELPDGFDVRDYLNG